MKKLLLLPFLFITVISFGQVPTYVPSNGLVGYWGFNGNANDESVNTNDGTVNGASLTSDRFGNANSAYDFDGLDDRIEVSNSNSLNPANVTFNFWMYANSDNVCLLSKKNHNDATNHSYAITHQEIWNGNRGLRTSWGSNCIVTGSIGDWGPLGAVLNNNWVMLTISIDSGGLCKQHINAALNYTFDLQDFFTCNDSNSPLFFGHHWSSDPKWMNGKIDDIGIWSRVLDSCEIIDLYNAELSCATSINELDNSLVNLFPNPSNDIITLTLAQHSNGQIILTDILGKEVLSKSFTANEVQLNLNNLAAKGTYFAKIIDVDGNVIAIKKLIYQ